MGVLVLSVNTIFYRAKVYSLVQQRLVGSVRIRVQHNYRELYTAFVMVLDVRARCIWLVVTTAAIIDRFVCPEEVRGFSKLNASRHQ